VNIQKKEDSNISVLMRIMTNYMQIIAASLSYNLQFPTYILDILSSAKQVGQASGVFLSFDWLLMETKATEIFDNIAYLKVLSLALIPIFLVISSAILYKIIFLRNAEKFKRYCCVTIITILFLMHPSLTQFALRIFKWVNIGEGISKVEMDIVTDWWSFNHVKWIFALCKFHY
jgi:CBS domain containing-hemolysin-like protein